MKKTSILVVDDDPSYVQLVRANLQVSGYQVIIAREGLSALDIVEKKEPDLVILDVMMPGINGIEVCRRMREFSLVPVIMLTARGEMAQKVEGFEAGADDYVTKPFGAPELLARVRAVLRRCAPAAKKAPRAVFNEGELAVDFAHNQVFVNGQDARLTRTEHGVLSYLVANKGFVVPQEELLSKVWGAEYQGDREILKVCMSRLRKKIEPDPRNPRYIQTKQGIGYVFEATGAQPT
jgi:DNA-binding response OmpR family regulator